MAKFYTANKETGIIIAEVKSIAEGEALIELYEAADRMADCYEEDFYDVVDENHCSVR